MASVKLVRLTPDVMATLTLRIGGHVAQRRASAEQRCRYAQGLGHALAKDTRRQPEPHFDDEGRGDALERGTLTVMSGIDPRYRQVDRTTPQCSGGCDTWIDAKRHDGAGAMLAAPGFEISGDDHPMLSYASHEYHQEALS